MEKIIATNKEYIIKCIDEYNSINKELSRYVIFNDFMVIWKETDNKIILDMYPSEEVKGDWDALFRNPLVLDLTDQSKIEWLKSIIKILMNNAKQKLDEAKQLARPQNGILIYDSQTDAYFLNPNTASAILKSKQIKKTIIWTRLEMFGIFINLHEILFNLDFAKEIAGLSLEEIITKTQTAIVETQTMAKNETVLQFIPSYLLETNCLGDEVELKASIKEILDQNLQESVAFENKFYASYDNKEQLIDLYNNVRRGQTIANHLAELKARLVAENKPQIFTKNQAGQYIATEVGQKIYDRLNLLEFLNKDVTETVFEI
ncbi:hypothetical protein SCLARK_001038 [Spiroplasma clarkii]|uniref:Uncharacterized protein n=1 Tax=Spiroplasma clarkii TaxID=2139 RepID=A0A1Y0L1H0_9MOLU|nr:hypothetical protein [Spiroplasma clarkii]ARU91620.1 hypothetical protein SCLARK_001038 [Spiroplasma clarkii]ATX71016.1 hypothetical protein SCLAR_v1c06990 [Spiroplasma clarkii]